MSIGNQLMAAINRRLDANLVIAGEIVATEVRRNIQQSPRGGKTYVKDNPPRIHVASAPGESPATDLGFLVRSIQVETDLQNHRVFVVSLHSIAPYNKKLEYGDMSIWLQPRPFMFKSLDTKKNQVERIIKNAVNQAVRDMQGVQP